MKGFRWLFVVVCVVLLIAGVGWGLLGSTLLANTAWSMQVRLNVYVLSLKKIYRLVKSYPFGVTPVAAKDIKGESRYLYMLVGAYERIDVEKQILYVHDYLGREYGYQYYTTKGDTGPVIKIEDTDYSINDTQPMAWPTSLGKDGASPYQVGDVLLITWDDKRTLHQILAEAAKDPQHLVDTDAGTIIT